MFSVSCVVLYTTLFTSWITCTVASFSLDAKLLRSNMTSGRLCLAGLRIWPVFDLSWFLSCSVREESCSTALEQSTGISYMCWMFFSWCIWTFLPAVIKSIREIIVFLTPKLKSRWEEKLCVPPQIKSYPSDSNENPWQTIGPIGENAEIWHTDWTQSHD